MDFKELLGTSAGPFEGEATSERIQAFCRAVGAPDESVAPATFLTVFRNAEHELFNQLNVDISRVLHTEQEFRLESPLEAGDRLIYTATLTRALEKRGGGGRLQFLTFETYFRAKRGSTSVPLGTATTSVVIRAAA